MDLREPARDSSVASLFRMTGAEYQFLKCSSQKLRWDQNEDQEKD